MEMSWYSMWVQSGPVAKAVLIILFLLSIYSIAVMFEKFTSYRAARSESLQFLPEVTQFLKQDKLQAAVDASTKYKKSHIAKVMHAGLLEIMNQRTASGTYDSTEAIQRQLEMASALTAAEMKRGLGGLGTIGSTAPFIGLFGTVVGIVNSFTGMAMTGSGGLGAVSAGIAEALIATAVGLLVAIPAVMAFNYFTGRLERFQIEMTNSSAELLDFFLKRQGGSRAA